MPAASRRLRSQSATAAAKRSASPPIATAQAISRGPGTVPSNRSSKVAAGAERAADQGNLGGALAIDRDRRRPESLAAADRPLDLGSAP